MNKSSYCFISLIGLIVVLSTFMGGIVFAAELKGTTGGSLNALNTGYAITRWPWNSGDVYPGQEATVRACTTEPPHPYATHVVFRWHSPDGTWFDVGPVLLTKSADTWGGKPIWDAYDTKTLDLMGDWGVQALFTNQYGTLQGPNPYPVVKIRAISWHVTPEVPFGTIATIITMFGALGIFYITRLR